MRTHLFHRSNTGPNLEVFDLAGGASTGYNYVIYVGTASPADKSLTLNDGDKVYSLQSNEG